MTKRSHVNPRRRAGRDSVPAVAELETITYERDGRVARITLDRPERGNAITLAMPRELAACVERADLDPEVHAIALAGNGSGFCAGYDLASAEQMPGRTRLVTSLTRPPPDSEAEEAGGTLIRGVAREPGVIAPNHDPRRSGTRWSTIR